MPAATAPTATPAIVFSALAPTASVTDAPAKTTTATPFSIEPSGGKYATQSWATYAANIATRTPTASPTFTPFPTRVPATLTRQPTPLHVNDPRTSSTQTAGQTPTTTSSPTPIGGGTGRIGFVSDREGREGVFSMNADGTDVRRLAIIPENSSMLNFIWSPDGTRIAFDFWNLNAMKDPKTCNEGVYVVNADGSEGRNVFTVCATTSASAWTPDGQRVGYTTAVSAQESKESRSLPLGRMARNKLS